MRLPPAWKVRRELLRIRDKSARRVAVIYEPFVDAHHRLGFDRRVVGYAGQLTPGGKIAVFLLYQPGGIAASTFFTCRHLVANGYSPLILSNAPLDAEDRHRLAETAWIVAERPNHGYDFGGYRDGLRMIREAGLDPDAVILMNDSTWFPLRASDTTLANLDARDAPFSGLSFKYEPRIGRGQSHMESHFLRFSRKALKSRTVESFWSRYVPSSFRITTIERGEKGVARCIEQAGLDGFAPLSREKLLQQLAAASPPGLRSVLAAGDFFKSEDIAERDALLVGYSETTAWAEAARTLVEALTARPANFLSGPLLYATARYLAVPFLKKSREVPFPKARSRFLSMLDAGDVPEPEAVVLSEIRAAVARDTAGRTEAVLRSENLELPH